MSSSGRLISLRSPGAYEWWRPTRGVNEGARVRVLVVHATRGTWHFDAIRFAPLLFCLSFFGCLFTIICFSACKSGIWTDKRLFAPHFFRQCTFSCIQSALRVCVCLCVSVCRGLRRSLRLIIPLWMADVWHEYMPYMQPCVAEYSWFCCSCCCNRFFTHTNALLRILDTFVASCFFLLYN